MWFQQETPLGNVIIVNPIVTQLRKIDVSCLPIYMWLCPSVRRLLYTKLCQTGPVVIVSCSKEEDGHIRSVGVPCHYPSYYKGTLFFGRTRRPNYFDHRSCSCGRIAAHRYTPLNCIHLSLPQERQNCAKETPACRQPPPPVSRTNELWQQI